MNPTNYYLVYPEQDPRSSTEGQNLQIVRDLGYHATDQDASECAFGILKLMKLEVGTLLREVCVLDATEETITSEAL